MLNHRRSHQVERFGALLRQLRCHAGLSQTALADAADVTQQAISKLEAGDCNPTWVTVCALASALGTDVAVFHPGERTSD